MPRYQFRYDCNDEGVTITLYRRAVFRQKEPVDLKQWADQMGEIAFAGVAHALALLDADDGRAVRDGDGIRFTHSVVAALTEPQAYDLGLPPATALILSIRAEHLITDPDFDLRAKWIDHANRPVYVSRRGAILDVGGQDYRVPEPIFSISDAIEVFRGLDTHEDSARFAAFAHLQNLMPEEAKDKLAADPYMRNFRILHATAFSLNLKTDGKSFQIDPVLFGRQVAARSSSGAKEVDHYQELADEIVSEAEGLLTQNQQRIFAFDRFTQYQEARDRYVIEGGVYVYLDPALKDALTVVRSVQVSDDDARKRFARSPQLYLKEALVGRYDDSAVEHLFIETEQYSRRIVDIGLWSPPVLPWIKRDPNDWLPERFGVQVGDKYVTLAAEDLPVLRQTVEAALERGEPKITFKGEDLPANRDTLDALSSLIGVVRPTTPVLTGKPSSDDDAVAQKHVLIVSENFDQIGFTHEPKPRALDAEREIPAAIKTVLKAHQKTGLAWLQQTWTKGYAGVLLADDMGLGKTFQLLVFLAWLKEMHVAGSRTRKEPVLVVAPTGLLRNWEDEHELHLHSPGLGQVCRAYGSHLTRLKKERLRDIETGMPALDDGMIRESDWVLTTYETLRDYHFSFAKVRFACVAFDEMQKVKNAASLLAQAAKTVNGSFMVGLTGTPIENRLEDLWTILDILNPGRLGDLKSFSANFKPEDNAALERLRVMLLEGSPDSPAPVLRRLKADHLEGLPEKRVYVRRRKMPASQAKAYAAVVTRAMSEDAGPMLETLHHLRGISLHPVWPQTNTISDPEAYISQSARLMETFTILDEISKRGEKALIFLESLDMQDQLALIIKRRYGLAKQPMQINGDVSGDKRKKAVDVFQNEGAGFDVMILSPKAGGVGLTLTAANHVIHLSRWWNPAVEDQCTDRIYRIGQDQPISVYYPMAVHPDYGDDSFDEVLNGLLERKRDLGRRMLIPPVNLKEDEAWFAERLSGRTKAHLDPADLNDIDRMEPQQFERWALSRMAPLGYVADRTPRSHDGGADGIVMHRRTKSRVILQCKLRHNENKYCDDEAIDDLLRARTAYGGGAITLVALTNATKFTDMAKRRAQDHGVTLIARDGLSNWPLGCL
jgi:hypothetical protein